MAKNTDYSFSHTNSDSRGTMICATCGEKIENTRYMSYKKWKDGNWGYVCHHLSCALLNDGFVIKYADYLKEEAHRVAEHEKKKAKEKQSAVKLINQAYSVEILDDEYYDCDKVILIYEQEIGK